nr:immunoglobulin heavy chain junction region [Macaca mulatta]
CTAEPLYYYGSDYSWGYFEFW